MDLISIYTIYSTVRKRKSGSRFRNLCEVQKQCNFYLARGGGGCRYSKKTIIIENKFQFSVVFMGTLFTYIPYEYGRAYFHKVQRKNFRINLLFCVKEIDTVVISEKINRKDGKYMYYVFTL